MSSPTAPFSPRPRLWYAPQSRLHDPGNTHPESPWRSAAIERALLALPGLRAVEPEPATRFQLLQVHDAEYVDEILLSRGRTHQIDHETHLSADSVEAALRSAGAAWELGRHLATSDLATGFALCRPPGHHATRQRGLGYCIFNNVALAAAAARASGLQRVLIVDWDAHHGNGTEDVASSSPATATLSIHEQGLFPSDSGFASTAHNGAFRFNVPLPSSSGDGDALHAIELLGEAIATAHRPDVILVSCGFDGAAPDPMSTLGYSREGFVSFTYAVRRLARRHTRGRLGLVLEGGYDDDALTNGIIDCVGALTAEHSDIASKYPVGSEVRQLVAQLMQRLSPRSS